MSTSESLQVQLEHEQAARRHAEAVVEQKTRELVQANAELRQLADHLEELVYQRTAELANARDEAMEANKSKSQFLANMSHELRTPLNAVIGYSEMLMEEADDGAYGFIVPDLQKIHAAGNHLLKLINDILDLSKIEAGKMELFLESFDIADMLHEVVATITPLVEKSGNTLETFCDPAIGTMHADLTKLRQALFNLLSNANKFTDHGTIRLSARRTRRRSGQEWIEFDVTDSGIGMNTDQLARLFQPFTQADAGTTRRYGGTGLGLTITRRFCEMMDGDVRVASEPGRGSTFTIQLPVHVNGLGTETPEPAVVSGTGETVLVIDDDPVARELLRRFLTDKGYRVETAEGGEEGLLKAHTLKPAAITLDVMMPRMDGWSVLAALKSSPELSDVPVVMLTIVNEKNMGFALGAADYLTKPIDRNRLMSILERYRNGKSRPRVLLVEDDAPTRELVRRTLEKSNVEIIEAEDGQRGLDRLAAHAPDLVLLDLMMPIMDGFEFVNRVRSNEAWRHIPLVVVTAKELTDYDRRRLDGEVEKILQKCVYSREDLLAEVQRLIGMGRAGVALSS